MGKRLKATNNYSVSVYYCGSEFEVVTRGEAYGSDDTIEDARIDFDFDNTEVLDNQGWPVDVELANKVFDANKRLIEAEFFRNPAYELC